MTINDRFRRSNLQIEDVGSIPRPGNSACQCPCLGMVSSPWPLFERLSHLSLSDILEGWSLVTVNDLDLIFLQDSQIHTYRCIRIVFFWHLCIFFWPCQVTKACLPRSVPWRNQVRFCGHAIQTGLSRKILLKKFWSAWSWLRFFVGNTFASTLSKQPVTITLTRFLSWQKTSPQKTISTTNISPSCSFVDGFLKKKNAQFL